MKAEISRLSPQSDIKYGGYCYSVGYNILGVREDTEECVNETWLRAWNSIPPQKPKMLSAFFGRITKISHLTDTVRQRPQSVEKAR